VQVTCEDTLDIIAFLFVVLGVFVLILVVVSYSFWYGYICGKYKQQCKYKKDQRKHIRHS
jgi:hypothetical protein